jgi:hypothetical protein
VTTLLDKLLAAEAEPDNEDSLHRSSCWRWPPVDRRFLLRREKSRHDEALTGLQRDRPALLYERILVNIRDLTKTIPPGR